jgi:hypothetical protein
MGETSRPLSTLLEVLPQEGAATKDLLFKDLWQLHHGACCDPKEAKREEEGRIEDCPKNSQRLG